MDTHNPEDGASADALSLAADQAEAEAAEAEAMAAAARAKAQAIRLRREAAESAAGQAADEGWSADAEETDDTEEADEVDEPAAAAPERAGVPRWLPLVAATLLVVLSLGLLGFGGWKLWQLHQINVAQQQQQDQEHRKAEFAAAAAQGVVNLMSLDYQHAKEDMQRIVDGTTGDFKKDMEASANDFLKVSQSAKAVTKATVAGTAVQKMDGNTATVLVAANVKVTNAASQDQQPRAFRWSVDVVREGDQIKLAKVEFVP